MLLHTIFTFSYNYNNSGPLPSFSVDTTTRSQNYIVMTDWYLVVAKIGFYFFRLMKKNCHSQISAKQNYDLHFKIENEIRS